MKSYENFRTQVDTRIQVTSHKSNLSSKINDNRAASIMQAKMLSAIQYSGQGRPVVQCRLKVGGKYYATLEDVKDLMASDPVVGWDDRWESYVKVLLEREDSWN